MGVRAVPSPRVCSHLFTARTSAPQVQLPLLFTLSIVLSFKKFKLLPPAAMPTAAPAPAPTTADASASGAAAITKKPKKQGLWSSLVGGSSAACKQHHAAAAAAAAAGAGAGAAAGAGAVAGGGVPVDFFAVPEGYTQVQADASHTAALF